MPFFLPNSKVKLIGYLFFSLLLIPVRFIYNLVLSNVPVWFQVLVFSLWGIVLVVAIQVLIFEKNRTRFFSWLHKKIGTLAPFAYSFILLIISIYFFASVNYTLVNANVIQWSVPPGPTITPAKLQDFYFWHFLDSIPVLKINDTLRYKEPLIYDNPLIGFFLLIFKITVISPIIGAFIWNWKNIKQEKPDDNSIKRVRKRVSRVSHRMTRFPHRNFMGRT